MPNEPGRPDGPDREEMTRWLMEATTDYALLMEPDGTLCVVNDRLAKKFGLNPLELRGRCLYDFFTPDKAAKRRSVADLVCRHKAPLRYDEYTSDGRILDTRVQPLLDRHGVVCRIAIHMADVTDQIRIERDRFLLASAVQQTAEAVIITDPAMVIRSVNQSFEAMTGYSAHEARGMPLADLYQGLRQQAELERINQALIRGDTWSGRAHNTRKDGSVIMVSKTVSPIRGRYGAIHGYISVWRDETREAELEKQLHHAQKMEAIGTLAGGIAHDFNNILGPIILHSELGLSSLARNSPARSHFQHILDAAGRARGLVNQILKLSRSGEADEAIPFRLSLLLKECLKLLRPTLPAGIAIETDLADDNDVILADPSEIHQVIMNLATNAAHAMEETGGRLRFRVQGVSLDAPRPGALSEAGPGRYVALTVSDTGQGMSPDIREHIFDPFFTTRCDGRGTGLGLAVVHNIVTGLGGCVQVDSVPGQGASFCILVPASPLSLAQGPDERVLPAPRGNERLLLVDDDPAVLESCEMILSELGYAVSTRSNGRLALERFQKRPQDFDLVLSNVIMPEMNGLDLTRELHLLRPDLPVILISGDSALIKAAEAKGLDLSACLHKPCRKADLALAVRKALDHKGDTPNHPARLAPDHGQDPDH